MKHLLRSFFFNLLALWLLAVFVASISYGNTFKNLVIAAFVYTLLEFVVLPILKILFMPITLLTLGLLAWIPRVIIFYLLTLIVATYSIGPISIPSITLYKLTLPAFHLGGFLSLVLAGLLIFWAKKGFRWLVK